MSIIRLENVNFSYEATDGVYDAIKDFSLEIEKGEFVAVLGKNGSGKSTFAKLLNALILPSFGHVFIDEKDTADYNELFYIRSNVGMVFQNPDNQMVASIVEDDIAFGPENIGVDPVEIESRIEWALQVVKMSEHRQSAPFKMSGGQKQRIAIASILAMRPKVIVFDESTSMLDPVGRNEVLTVIRRLVDEEKITVIFITHDMNEAILADRVIIIEDGKLKMDGPPKKIFVEDDIEACGLKLPLVLKIVKILKKAGLSIRPDVMDKETLEGELCRLL